jgi:hypothetical protein
MVPDPLDDCVGFDWDDGNIDKNWYSHQVAWWECEEIFFNRRMASTRKKIPTFSSEDEERTFWTHADSTEYIDWSKAKERPLSRLKPTLRTISISLPEFVVAELTRLAQKRDVSYESLLKTYLVDRIQAEIAAEKRSSRSS